MRRFSLGLILIAFVALVAAAPGSRTAVAQGGPSGQILQLVNQVRAEHGLAPYRYNATLAVAAQNHANWMAANVIYSHTGANGSSPNDRARAVGYNGYVSENIVGGWHMTPNEGVIWWRNSDLHYRMMVSTRYSEAGVGYATNGTQNMYVLVMGRPAGSRGGSGGGEPQAEPLIITPIELAEPAEDGSITHVVQDGQALWQIAVHYDAELRDLLLFNHLEEDDFLQPGDEIVVRLADDATPPPTPTPPLSHVVREGDTAWIIARRYDIPIDTFFYLNTLNEESLLQPGQEVRVRLAPDETPPPTPTPKLTHVVREGDTLSGIAVENGITLDELLSYNGITRDTLLQIGDELYIRPPFTPTPTPTATLPPTATAFPTSTPTPTTSASGAAAALAAPPAADTEIAAEAVSARGAEPLASPAPTDAVQTPAPATVPADEDDADNMPLFFGMIVMLTAAILFWRGRN